MRSATIAADSYKIVTALHSARPFLCGKSSAGGIGIHSGGTLEVIKRQIIRPSNGKTHGFDVFVGEL